MGLMTRFQTIVRAEVTSLCARFEDPEKLLDQLIIDLEEALSDAKRGAVRAIADENRLRIRCEEHERETGAWRGRAAEAVARGDDAGAREALRRADEHEGVARGLREQHERQHADTRKLRDAIRDLAEKIDEARRRRNVLLARLKRSRAQKEIYGTLRGISETSALAAFDRMDERVAQVEAEAEAAVDLEDDLDPSAALRRDLDRAEREERVEAGLRSLKDAARPAAPSPGAPPAARSRESAG